MNLKKPRKNRQDRMHVVYVITNVLTKEQYVGITVCGQKVRKALKVRMQKHAQRARVENKPWALCEALREYGPAAFEYGVVEFVRGRKPAHARERQVIAQFAPALNTK
jgi:hypothetical protein